jgi:SAM-dependent methyltransferase
MSRVTHFFRELRARLSPKPPPPPTLNDHIRNILRGLRRYNFEALKPLFGKKTWHKYLDVDRYVPVSVTICDEAGLIGARPQRILDIGCGSGLFLYSARHFGHDGIGIDIETGVMAAMAKLLKIKREIERVSAFTPLKRRGRFNLIVCLGTQFDHPNPKAGQTQWGVEEWAYFLSDLRSQLYPRGRVFLRINKGKQARQDDELLYNMDVHRALKHGHLHGIAYHLDSDGLDTAIANLNVGPASYSKPLPDTHVSPSPPRFLN